MSSFDTPIVNSAGGQATGGTNYTLTATLAYTDITAKTLFTIPAGAFIIQQIYNVTAAFDAGSTNPINIGTQASTTRFANGIDASATGLKTANVVVTEVGTVQGSAVVVKGIYVPTGTPSSHGAMTILFVISVP